MIGILQDLATRKWGVRISEDMDSGIKQGGTSSYRSLLEIFEFESMGEVMPFIQRLQDSLKERRGNMVV
jgi:hypothetical protein